MCVFVYVWYIHLYMHGCLCDTPISTYGCEYEISWWQWWLVWACNVCQYVTDIMCVSLSLCTQCVYAYTYVCPYYTACIYSPRWRRCLLVWAKSSSCPLAAAGGGRAASARVCAASKTGKVRPRERSDLCCWCSLEQSCDAFDSCGLIVEDIMGAGEGRGGWVQQDEAPAGGKLSISLFAILSFCIFICICICNLICNCIET